MESDRSGSSGPASVGPGPHEDETRRRGKGRFEDEDEHDGHIHGAGLPNESQELVENAKSHARPAGYAMLVASIITTIVYVGNAAINVVAGEQILEKDELVPLLFFSGLCSLFLYLPILTFMGLGARSLFTLGSRRLVVTAVVMNFIVAMLTGGAVLLNVLMWAAGLIPVPDFPVCVSLAMCSVSGLANLTAAVMAIRVLIFREVADAYAARAEEQRRY